MSKGVNCLIFTDCETLVVVGGHRVSTWQRTAGAYRMATELRALGYTVQVIDHWSHLTMEGPEVVCKLAEKFVGTDTIFVGFSTTFFSDKLQAAHNADGFDYQADPIADRWTNAYSTRESTLLAFKAKVQSLNASTSFIIAGARCHNHDPLQAVIVVGYGEMNIREFLKWKAGENKLFVGRRTKRGAPIFESNIKADGFDFAHSTIDWHPTDCIEQEETLPIEVSRGCIFRCKFCAFPLNGKSKLDYLKDPEVMHDEFVRNYERWGTTRYIFSDDTYNDTTEKLEYMQRIVDQLPFKLEFATYARLDLMVRFPEQAELMLNNGLTAVFFGVESYNPEAAKAIGKGMPTEKLVDKLYELREKTWGHKVHVTSGIILGLPYDTYPVMSKWLERVIDPRFPLHDTIPTPLGINFRPESSVRAFWSELDQNAAKWGYRQTNRIPGRQWTNWSNDRFGTSYQGCVTMAEDVVLYFQKHMGCFQYGAHISMSMYGYGYSPNDLMRGRRDITPDPMNANALRLDRYLKALMAINIEEHHA